MRVTIDIEFPAWMKRATKLMLPAAVVATAGLALADVPHTFTAGQTLSAQQLNENFASLDAQAVPSGSIVAYAGQTPPAGWLLCDGAAVSRTGNASLFAAVGIAYGPGDGTTTFNLPDLRGRSVFGAGTGSGLTVRSNGQRAGAESVTLAVAQLPAHSHTITDPGHAHGASGGNVFITAGGPAANNAGIATGSAFNYTAATTTATTGITGTNATGSGSPVSIMPPFQVATFIIKI